jgi:hypothetical protein
MDPIRMEDLVHPGRVVSITCARVTFVGTRSVAPYTRIDEAPVELIERKDEPATSRAGMA